MNPVVNQFFTVAETGISRGFLLSPTGRVDLRLGNLRTVMPVAGESRHEYCQCDAHDEETPKLCAGNLAYDEATGLFSIIPAACQKTEWAVVAFALNHEAYGDSYVPTEHMGSGAVTELVRFSQTHFEPKAVTRTIGIVSMKEGTHTCIVRRQGESYAIFRYDFVDGQLSAIEVDSNLRPVSK